MKKQEWNEALNHLDPSLVQSYVAQKDKIRKNNRQKSLLLRIGALAACLAIIVSSVIIIPTLMREDPISPSKRPTHTPIYFNALESPKALTGSNLAFIHSSSSGGGPGSPVPPAFGFGFFTGFDTFIVKARVVENYPDQYYKLEGSPEWKPTAYRLIRMECLDVLWGENLPSQFFYMIPDSLYVDMSKYDSLLIKMDQFCTADYIIKNGTQNQLEALDVPLFTDPNRNPEFGHIIAFSDGVFDEDLWKSPNWVFGYQFGEYCLDEPDKHPDLLVSRGATEEGVIANVLAYLEKQLAYYGEVAPPTLIELVATTQEAQDALEYVKPFANGVFVQTYLWKTQVVFTRYINGCQTDETVSIDLKEGKATYSDVRYTPEDLSKLENISLYLAQMAEEYARELPNPPHTNPNGKKLISLSLHAWYIKKNGKIYGVIKTTWIYWRYDSRGRYDVRYYDDAYILYDMSRATSQEISREMMELRFGPRNLSLYYKYGADPLPEV